MNPLYPHLSIKQLRDTAILLMWALAAVATRDLMPWLFWVTMIALPALVLFRSEWTYLQSAAGRRILQICLLLLMVHLIWALGRSYYYDPAQFGTYWNDDHNYYNEAAALADAWSEGQYPAFWKKGSPPYLGTLHTGYHRPLATLFLFFGAKSLWGLILNALCASTIPLLAALISRYLWAPDSDGSELLRHDYGFLAAVLVALHPTQFYWASYLLKDMYVAFVFMAGLALVLATYRRRSIALGISILFILPYMFTVRAYTAVSLAAGAAVLPFMKVRRKILVRVAVIGFASLFLLLAYTTRGNALYRQLRDSFVALAPAVGAPADLLLQMLAGIPRLFLAPYAWIILSKPTPMYGMYPGMWYLYIIGYPLAFSGLYFAIRRNCSAAVVPLTVFGLSALIFLSAVYQGDASRQRFSLEYLMLVFSAYGLRNLSWWCIFGILSLEVGFAIGQLLSLR